MARLCHRFGVPGDRRLFRPIIGESFVSDLAFWGFKSSVPDQGPAVGRHFEHIGALDPVAGRCPLTFDLGSPNRSGVARSLRIFQDRVPPADRDGQF